MGCGGSGGAGGLAEARRNLQPKTPILLFYLPGSVREAMVKILANWVSQQTAAGEPAVNVRFVDAANSRGARRFWVSELNGRRDIAASLYLADLRDHATMLLTVRTLSWFLRTTCKNYDVKVVALYTDQTQLMEFKEYLPGNLELVPLCEKDADAMGKYIELLRAAEQKFADQKRVQKTTTLRA